MGPITMEQPDVTMTCTEWVSQIWLDWLPLFRWQRTGWLFVPDRVYAPAEPLSELLGSDSILTGSQPIPTKLQKMSLVPLSQFLHPSVANVSHSLPHPIVSISTKN